MSEQAAQTLRQLLDASEDDTAFLALVPEAAVTALARDVREVVEQEDRALIADIVAAGDKLPAPLGRLARTVLG